MSLDVLLDLLMNAISPLDPGSNSTFQPLLDDSTLPFSLGIKYVAVMIHLPFTTCHRREVERILFELTTLIGTAGELSIFFSF